MHAFQTRVVQGSIVLLLPFDIHDNYVLTAKKNWSDTYKSLPFVSKGGR